MVVQWFRLHASTVGDMGSATGWRTKILVPHSLPPSVPPRPGRTLEVIRCSYSVITTFYNNYYNTPQDVSVPEI